MKKTGVPKEEWKYDAAGQVTYYSSVQPAQVSPGLPMGLNSPGFARPPVRHDFYYKYDEAGNRSEM
ncbi:MAG: hypothetical protein ABFE08_22095, partial [Armatimonadia bacterium]